MQYWSVFCSLSSLSYDSSFLDDVRCLNKNKQSFWTVSVQWPFAVEGCILREVRQLVIVLLMVLP